MDEKLTLQKIKHQTMEENNMTMEVKILNGHSKITNMKFQVSLYTTTGIKKVLL